MAAPVSASSCTVTQCCSGNPSLLPATLLLDAQGSLSCDRGHFEAVTSESPGHVPSLRPLVLSAPPSLGAGHSHSSPAALPGAQALERHPRGAQCVRESPSSRAAVPGVPGRSWAEHTALPEVRMEPKLSFAFALAQCGCSYKQRTAGGNQHIGAVIFAPTSPNPAPLPVLSYGP